MTISFDNSRCCNIAMLKYPSISRRPTTAMTKFCPVLYTDFHYIPLQQVASLKISALVQSLRGWKYQVPLTYFPIIIAVCHSHPLIALLRQGRLQGCAACAAAQGAERVGAPIPNHKFQNSRALYGCQLEHNRKESEWKANWKHRNSVRGRIDSPLLQMGKTTGPSRIFHRHGLFHR
jgi:hypothetical protein